MTKWQATRISRFGPKTLGDMAGSIAVAREELSASERQLPAARGKFDRLDSPYRRRGAAPLRFSGLPHAAWFLNRRKCFRYPRKEAIHPEDVGVLDNRRKWSNGGTPTTVSTYRMRRKDGSYVWVGRPFRGRSRWRLDSRVNCCASSSFAATSTSASPPSVSLHGKRDALPLSRRERRRHGVPI